MEKNDILEVISKLKEGIRREIQKRKWNHALALISTAADILYGSNIYYYDKDLENALSCVSEHLIVNNNYRGNSDMVLFYDGFGLNNRGLIQIYLNALCRVKRVVYVTLQKQKDNLPDVMDILRRKNAAVYFLDGKSYTRDIERLNQIVCEKCPGHFFFYASPCDVVGSVVLNAYEGKIKRYQINLTDHAFWLGAKPIDYCIEFRDYGACVSGEYRRIPKEKIVKIPYYPIVKDVPFQGYPFSLQDGQKVIFSGGSIYKTNGGDGKYYKIVEYILRNYQDVIFWYAGERGSDHSINGTETTGAFKLAKMIERYPNRVFWTQERTDLFQVMQHCYFYLSTYPLNGGLMTQYAARAAKVPLSLSLDDNPVGILQNDEDLGIYFRDMKDLLEEIDRLLSNPKYTKDKGLAVRNALISSEEFDSRIEQLVNGRAEESHHIAFEHLDTEKFRKNLTDNFSEEILNGTIARRHNEILFKYFPRKFIRGGVAKLKRKLIDMR